jgi:CheY-like chemotaxis protein
MSNVQRLQQIPELSTDKLRFDASGNLPKAYMKALNDFTENFPAEEENLKKAFMINDVAAAAKSLLSVKGMLDDIYAEELASECFDYAEKLNGADGKISDRTKSYVSVLLSSVTSISVDIQMAVLVEGNIIMSAGGGEVKQHKEILAVDDDTYCLDMLRDALRNVQGRVVCAPSGKAAMTILNTRTPDLFILDIDMPDMDGLTLAKNIRMRGFDAPIVFITGNSNRVYVMRAISEGAADFIVKPINPKRVADRISKFL